jgi:hypothetical protein
VRSESRCALRLRYLDSVVSIEVLLKCAVVLLYSFVKQRLKCNTGEACNCLIQFLLTMAHEKRNQHFLSAQRLSERTVLRLTTNRTFIHVQALS